MTTSPDTLALPTIHLNGTSAKDLFSGYRAAMDALQDAQEALGKIEFNARDYYVQGPEAWTQARDEMQERRQKIETVRKDVEAILIHIMDNGNL